MQFLKQTWTLTKKDLLLIGRRSWFSTLLRALILPIVVTFVVAYVKVLQSSKGANGVQQPFELMSLQDAFRAGTRSKFVIVNRHLSGADVKTVINNLSSIAQSSGKDVYTINGPQELTSICPASSRGVTDCFAAVEFWSSPDEGPHGVWNYTLYFDEVIGNHFDINTQQNSAQVYGLPLQNAINSMIASAHGGPGLPDGIKQFGYTYQSQAAKEKEDRENWEVLVGGVVAWAFYIALCGTTYHLTGHVVAQRERGLLQLIDTMMPNRRRWQCIVARTISTHLAFDIVYLPGWIAMGAITGAVAFPYVAAGWCILLYILAGLALSSYSILASSLFRREQLAAISTVLAALVFALATQFGESLIGNIASPAGVWALAVLFPPSTFVYFIMLAAYSTKNFSINGDSGYTFYSWSPLNTFGLSGGILFALFAFQIIAYPIIGGLIEKRLHGVSSRSRHLRTRQDMGSEAVRLSGFSKHYNIAAKKRDRVKAVDELSLTLHAGSITVLLGTNGSGKTTTLNAIAGQESITKGQIEIDGTGGIGLCPQKNVHWAAMTVEEHVKFFEQLKRPSFTTTQSSHEVDRIVSGCDLEIKRNARAKTLSGGQMRKLQLAMMLAGGSQVCCIDEASSGIDPLARRKVWDILLRERGQRTMLLTTHFLDETEVLSDHVAILSKGQLKAEGSVASLKNQFGGGYHVVLPNQESLDRLGDLPPGITHSQDYNTTTLEASDVSALAHLVAALDRTQISDYRIQGPTIEDVFLKLAEEMKIVESDVAAIVGPHATVPGSDDLGSRSSEEAKTSTMRLNSGKGCSPAKQTAVLFLKRLTVLKHNFMPYVAALFVPLVLAGMVTRFFISKDYPNGLPCANPTYGYSYSSYSYNSAWILQLNYIVDDGVFGPESNVSRADLSRVIPNNLADEYDYGPGYSNNPQWRSADFVNSVGEFNTAMSNSVYDNTYKWGGFYIGEQTLFAFQSDLGSALFAQGSLHMLLTGKTIELGYSTFNRAFIPDDLIQGVVAVITVLGFTIYPGLFALYPTAERLRKVREMQYSNGILSSSLWVAYALFDFIFIVLVSVLATVIWSVCYQGWYALDYVFVVFLLYGMAATCYSYVISLWVKSQLSAIACTSLVQTVIAMLFFVGYFVSVNSAPGTVLYSWLNYIYFTMAVICPAVSLFRALLVTLNVYGLACRGQFKASYPGEITLFGGPILYLTLQIVFLTLLLMFWESGWSLEVFGIRRRRGKDIVEEIAPVEEQDGIDDEKHLALTEDGLRLYNLTKSFGPTRAVENLSLGILPSEKMALLGPNGAGKSTTISLIRGEMRPDATDPPAAVFISGDSLMHAPVAAKNHLGVCPQFDAVDSMTLSEHLHFYARARGVPNKNANIKELITTLGLTEHANKLVKKLSGGTKRKLSLAIALISNPSVLLLDEPSSGMDPAARRALWRTLTNISAGRSLLLTTHSMEEAAALCDRAAIMATQLLAIGTIDDLCARHGDKIYIHIVHQNAPYTTAADMSHIWEWARSTFLIAEAEQRNFGGQLRFAVPVRQGRDNVGDLVDGNDMGRLFRIIEEKKAEMGIRDYSVGPTTLGQVFLNVVSKHDVVEENTTPDTRSRWAISRLFR